MRQGVLGGRTAGLRPAERRRLERLCHRRHPPGTFAELLTLQRLADEARGLELPLSLVIDARGLCRLLWVGELESSTELRQRLGGERRQSGDLRLITCRGSGRHPQLQPQAGEALVALDLEPRQWLRYGHEAGSGGRWPALLLRRGDGAIPWLEEEVGELSDLCERPPDAADDMAPSRQRHGVGTTERVLLLCLSGADARQSQREVAELEGLVRSAGADPVGVVEQKRRPGTAPSTIWGEGKLQEAALEARRLQADLVVTDRELTPVQGRNLERILDLPVSDRSELILDIFAQRAASGAGRLQVELAQLRYRLPRLSGRGSSLSRQGGGIGTRGPGETQLEKDRRAISRRLERLQRQVSQLGEHRSRLRQRRGDLPRVALVGYTNAGKSSLLNALTRAPAAEAVLAEDKLFATLDPTTRRLTLLDGESQPRRTLLITDTVGFIRDLPPPLVEAFRSTIEEALDADGLLLVVDLADPAWPEQLRTVRGILEEFGSREPCLVIGNQIDRCPASELERARSLEPEMLFISATADLGLANLRQRLLEWPPAPASGSGASAVPVSAG